MKEILQKNKKILVFLFSIIIVSLFKINPLIDGDFSQKLIGNSIDYVLYAILLMVATLKVFEIKDKRMYVIAFIVSLILTGCHIIGYAGVNGISYLSKVLWLKAIGYLGLFYIAVLVFYNFLNKIELKNEKWRLSNKKIFFFSWILIFICYIPYLLKFFPGITTMDSTYQIYQSVGHMDLINSHPIFHTMLISIVMNIGNFIQDYNLGIALYSVCQMVFMSGVFAFCILYMKKKNVPKVLIIFSFIYYAIHPMFSMYSVTMWKDIPFSIAITLYTISMVELATNTEKFLESKLRITFFIVSALLTMFFKHNGFYIILLSIPFVLFYVRKYFKKLLVIYVLLIVFYKIVNGPVLDILNVKPTLPSEALSIPIQQLSRVVATAQISDDEYNEIREWICAEQDVIREEYNPRLSDPMKKYFNNERFKEDKISFIKVWLKYLGKYPSVYVQSFLSNTYGYWYPEAKYWMFQRSVGENELGMHQDSKLDIKLLDEVVEDRNVPIISMVTSLGFAFWITGIMAFYVIYKKEYKKIIIFIPVMVLWLTSIASSVFCEFRYMFGFFTTMPIILSTFIIKDIKEKI